MLFYYWNCGNNDYYYSWLGTNRWTTDRHIDGPTDRQTLLPIKLLLLLEFKKIWLLKLVVTLFYFVRQYYQNSWLQTDIPSNIAAINLLLQLKVDMYHYHLHRTILLLKLKGWWCLLKPVVTECRYNTFRHSKSFLSKLVVNDADTIRQCYL